MIFVVMVSYILLNAMMETSLMEMVAHRYVQCRPIIPALEALQLLLLFALIQALSKLLYHHTQKIP